MHCPKPRCCALKLPFFRLWSDTCVSLCSPGRPCVKHWWEGAATLQIRALHAIGTASEPPASQAFKPTPYSPPVHALTVLLALVDPSYKVCVYEWVNNIETYDGLMTLNAAAIRAGHACRVGCAGDERWAHGKRSLIACSERSSQYMCSMCSEERNVECPGGLWRPGIGVLANLASI